MKVVSADEMREIDRRATREYGLPGLVLMENAGRGAADAIEDFIQDIEAANVLVIAGKGNNGGDGFVAARHLVNSGLDCEVVLVGKRVDVKGDARINLDAVVSMGIEVIEISDDLVPLYEALSNSDLIVDALLGTGLTKEVKGIYAEVIDAVNISDQPVVSLDIPSGIDSTTGRPLGSAVYADMTVTFCLPKAGLLLYPGADYAGELVLADIGAPFHLLEDEGIKTSLILEDDVKDIFHPRNRDSHKGDYGHLLLIAGSRGKTGAAVMAADGALRSGAGLVTVAAPAALNDILEVKLTEVMTEPLPGREDGFLDEGSLADALLLLEGKSALVLGPGIGRREGAGRLVKGLLEGADIPLVVDADALWHLAEFKDGMKKTKAPVVLTPHPGEMGHLVGLSSGEVQADRINVARNFAVEYGCHLVLKGARTLIATPEGEVFINVTGNPGMASGGTGDVLCGMIGSFISQGYSPLDSSVSAVYLHGYAGDLVARDKGEAGMTATDIISRLPEVMKEYTAL